MNISNDSKGRAIRKGMKVVFSGVASNGETCTVELYTSEVAEQLIFKDSTGKEYDVIRELIEAHAKPTLNVVGYIADLCKVCGKPVGDFKVTIEDIKVHVECFFDATIPDAPSKMAANYEELEVVRKKAIAERTEQIKAI